MFSGRYGPYVKCGKVNATLPKDMAPETVTMDDAVKLIAARIEAGAGAKGAKKPRSSSPKGGSAKKPAAKAKTAAKAETAVANGKSVKAKPAKSASETWRQEAQGGGAEDNNKSGKRGDIARAAQERRQ